jgi:hypothetical protein
MLDHRLDILPLRAHCWVGILLAPFAYCQLKQVLGNDGASRF